MQLRATRLTAIASAVKRAFNIRSLFAGSVPGVWYDPSDMSTLFQDSAGTTPVTAVEQPVGLMLDKSQGLVLGPELVTNGDFSGPSLVGFIARGGALTITGGQLVCTGANTGAIAVISTVVGKTYQILGSITAASASVFIDKSDSSSTFTNRVQFVIGATAPQVSKTGVFTATATTSYLWFWVNDGTAGASITIDNISVKELPGNHAFQATSASRPVLKIDGNGKLYLRFDGVDDSLSTNFISFTATDKMSVFAGVRKLSDVAVGQLVELGANVSVNSGSFSMPNSDGGSTWVAAVKGLGTVASATATGITAPITTVNTSLMDLSLATVDVRLRINGTQAAASTTDTGGGNFSNYPLYIGRRNNASLPFNGQLYSMIIVGKAVTAGELSSTETFVAAKTGVTL